jgi:hypothetical protein
MKIQRVVLAFPLVLRRRKMPGGFSGLSTVAEPEQRRKLLEVLSGFVAEPKPQEATIFFLLATDLDNHVLIFFIIIY